MHAHLADADSRVLLLAYSISTVRNPSGGDAVLELIAAMGSGAVPGPRIDASGVLIDGAGSFWGPDVVAETTERVRERVREDAAAGYRAIKLYSLLTPEQFAAGVEEARAHGLQVYAHVPRAMTLQQVLALQVDSVEHLDGFERALGGEGYYFAQRWAGAQAEHFAPLAAQIAASGVWNVPTSIVHLAPSRAYAARGAADTAPEIRYADAALLEFWHGFAARIPEGTDRDAFYRMTQTGHDNRIAMLAALRQADANVLIGSDAPNPYVMYGFSIHEELGFFQDAGYSNIEILRIATLDAARFLGAAGEFGVLREGARADLLLLASDPEQDLDALRAPDGVMAAGRWYDRRTLETLLASAAARAATSRAAPQ
jgi:imidazolonepropionase-like amidohydrolase